MASVVQRINALGVQIINIPPGCTCLCQPVDVGINKPFKNRVKEHWRNWLNIHDLGDDEDSDDDNSDRDDTDNEDDDDSVDEDNNGNNGNGGNGNGNGNNDHRNNDRRNNDRRNNDRRDNDDIDDDAVVRDPTRNDLALWITESVNNMPEQMIKNSWRHGAYSYFEDDIEN